MSAPVMINGKRYIESGEVRLKDLSVGDFFRIKTRGAAIFQVIHDNKIRGVDLKPIDPPKELKVVKHLKPFYAELQQAPTHKFFQKEQAIKEAQRLSEKLGVEVFTLQCIYSVKPSPKFIETKFETDLPF